ncbi:ethanolamine ammonia-lyase subunit EutC [Methylicorpusculum sp.]|uniref:ethanolamine ammonia-lyase subunit EutC n=2 Tax=Methylicorpusculum sp. TaxID=2713644 RepID=UPI00272FCE6B|nr:ethanolamine ammonia-lyase subunit EutC [Methylicorpusculum sp.]MDP2180048.1 ethanolamine ammonia-lyase subunit EutC [Methylicorpusculum sp.]MDP3528287.1 ethanolamine ammonia-lyase subunit EutC [Methylicorpusculum sp.]
MSDLTDPNDPELSRDPWLSMKQFTPARIALGKAGMSLPTQACLDFQLAHALARDAVKSPLDFSALTRHLNQQGMAAITLQTQVEHHRAYLQRPDLGRLLSESALQTLTQLESRPFDAVVVVADGLSSKAIERHAIPFLTLLLPELSHRGYAVPPMCLVRHGRVAIGDALAEHFSARLCMVLIGERPGLSSPDSMGIYFTYQARSGKTTDADRNCISNIHQHGLSYAQALKKLLYLINEAERLQFSGVNLKDETSDANPASQLERANFLLD